MSLQTQEATSTQRKYREVLAEAEARCRKAADWVVFFKEVLAVDGVVRRAFPNYDELAEFERSEEFEQIQQMLAKLREKRVAVDADAEPTRVITVRLPKCMHETLRTEAHDLHTSMNKLCISKLLQVIDEEMIPKDRGGGTKAPRASKGASGNTTAAGPGPRAEIQPSESPLTPPPFKSSNSRL